MMWEEAGRGRRGDRPLRVAAIRICVAALALLGGLFWTLADSAAQDAAPQTGSQPDQLREQALRALARALADSQDQSMEQALKALRQGLAERGKGAGQSGDPLATGSIKGPVPRLWTAPAPLPRVAGLDPSTRPARGPDVERLFDPHPLGTGARFNRATSDRQQASLPEPRPAPPPATAPEAPPAAREQARVPDQEPSPPAPPRPAAATAAIEAPAIPPAPPPSVQPKSPPSPPPKADEEKLTPSAKPAKTKPATRKAPAPRTQSARRHESATPAEPDDDAADEARPRRRAAPKQIVRNPAAQQPDVTGSVTRAPPRATREASSRLPRSAIARPSGGARQQPLDISVIPLPDVLRPTRPPAESPL